MLFCPDCLGELVHIATDRGYVWTCAKCEGRVLSLGVLRRQTSEEYVQRLSALAGGSNAPRKRPCPMCSNYMTEIDADGGGEPQVIGLCLACHSAWFGPQAYHRIPFIPPPEPSPARVPPPMAAAPVVATTTGATSGESPALTQEQQERIAAVYAQTAAAQMNRKYKVDPGVPDAWWQRVAGYLGFPATYDEDALARTPWLTWIVAAAIVFINYIALCFSDMRVSIANLGFVPAQPFRFFGLTFLTSFLLHGSLSHLVGNAYSLVVFGRGVEGRLGTRFFFLLLISAALAGDLLHVAFDPHSVIPVIGASGGIAGLLTFYGLSFPRARLGFFVFFRWIRVPAIVFSVLWVVLQLLGARGQLAGDVGTAYLVHLGGAAVGVLFWLIWTFADENRAVGVER